MKFTKREIDAIKPTGKRETYFDDSFTGLAVRIMPSGHKSFYYTYRLGKGRYFEKKWIKLGTFPILSVEQAREKAKTIAANIHFGIDPIMQQQEEKEAIIVKDALQAFITDHIAKLKPQTRQSYERLINKLVLPYFGKIRTKDVTYSDVATFHAGLKDTLIRQTEHMPYYQSFLTGANCAITEKHILIPAKE